MQSSIIFFMEIIGTIAFACSGAMAGIRSKMDIFGVCVLGVITSVGGGMIRDIMLGIIPPSIFYHPVYLVVAVVSSCFIFIAFIIGRKHRHEHIALIYDTLMLIMDTIGLAIFTVLGVNTGISQGFADQTVLLAFVGTITGVGGGLLCDMMAGIPPAIFVKHVYASASIVGSIAVAASYNMIGPESAMFVGFCTVILIRFLAIYFKWNLPRIK